MSDSLVRDLIKHLETLSPQLQAQVMDYVRTLDAERARGVPGKDLVRFAGTISKQELAAMSRAIEQGCEQVDLDQW